MNIFVTGATGYIGSVVVERLQEAGHAVTGLARSDAAAEKLVSRGVRAVRGGLFDAEVIAAASREADAVIHAASTSGADAPEADAAARRAILGALEGSGKPFVYTSGVWVHGDTGESAVDEDAPLHPAAAVAWRVGAEQEVLDAAPRGVRSVVLRPAMVYGRGGGLFSSFFDTARERGAARFVGTGENHWPVVDVDDLADAYRSAVERETAGMVFDLARHDSVRVVDIARAASEAEGKGGRTEAWPVVDARRTLGALADALAMDQHVISARARAVLGWSPTRSGVLEWARGGRREPSMGGRISARH